jgi:hypothetical protein
MSGDKDYFVTMTDRKRQDYFVPLDIDNFAALDDECKGMIEMTIEA